MNPAPRLRTAARRCVVACLSGVVLSTLLVEPSAASESGPTAVKTYKIPSTMHLLPAPNEKRGPETVPVPIGPVLANLHDAVIGQTVDGIQCDSDERFVEHVHTHLNIFVNGQAEVVPYGIGIPGFQTKKTRYGPFVETSSCWYWLHTHADDGVIHIELPSRHQTFDLGQFFDEWGIPLSTTQVGPAQGTVTTFFNGRLYRGNPRDLPLGSHYQIQLDVGTPLVAPFKVTNWGDL
jgi:hypothetical protein